ncbi:hypothetical protein FRC01_005433 [Tulasnella sp. 417]|nr:hypothetical protein FRC01_005433 [Tulasnella sp. 417]
MDPSTPSKDWPGYYNLRYLFIFGASYSSVGYEPHEIPTEDMPLGSEYPGETWAEDSKPNWVGHLINKYYPKSPLLVYNYAVGGADIDGMRHQVERFHQAGSPGYPDSAVPWQANNSLFATWIGGNDVFNKDLDINRSMNVLFELQETFYDRGARNFLFFTIPSLPNASGGRRSLYKDRESRGQAWNESLKTRIHTEFTVRHPDASVFVFDTWELFERMLTNPADFGFSAGAGRGFDQEMYWDSIHPTSAVHRVVAKVVADFLAGEDVGEDQPEKFVIRPRVAPTALEIEL